MAHTFLSLDMDLIPQATKDNVPTFYSGYFSNEGSRLLIDGYMIDPDGNHIVDSEGEKILVHPQSTFDAWLQWSENHEEIQAELLNTSIEYTKLEIKAETKDLDSIWYRDPDA